MIIDCFKPRSTAIPKCEKSIRYGNRNTWNSWNSEDQRIKLQFHSSPLSLLLFGSLYVVLFLRKQAKYLYTMECWIKLLFHITHCCIVSFVTAHFLVLSCLVVSDTHSLSREINETAKIWYNFNMIQFFFCLLSSVSDVFNCNSIETARITITTTTHSVRVNKWQTHNSEH